jgi:hypothetical protein
VVSSRLDSKHDLSLIFGQTLGLLSSGQILDLPASVLLTTVGS